MLPVAMISSAGRREVCRIGGGCMRGMLAVILKFIFEKTRSIICENILVVVVVIISLIII